MQNIVNQNKTTRIRILDSAPGYLFHLGNYRGNGLVTERLQQFAHSRFLAMWKNRVVRLILNNLRFICSVLFSLAFADFTHLASHTCGTKMTYLWDSFISFFS